MTAGANSLTERVKTPARAPDVWSMAAKDVRVLMSGLDNLGYSSNALLASAGLHDIDFTDPDTQVRCDTIGAILSLAQQTQFTPNLALELARRTPIGAYPLLDYLVVTSDTVAAGVRQLARYFRLTGSPVAITVREEVDCVRVETAAQAPFAVEYNAALMVFHLRTETEGRFAAAGVNFQHQPDDPAGYERALGCAVVANASWSGLNVAHDAWRLPLRRRDPVLRHMLESQADEILARLPLREGLALEVQRALSAQVAGGDTRIESLARQLAMSPRTLQRRLAAEGVSYQELLADTRKEAAGRYISESTLAIGEVAYLVGYSEPAPFHRAFKRWYGMTPEIFRRKRRQAR